MRINPIQQRNNTNAKPNFQASVKLSPKFNQYYTPGKIKEATQTIHNLGSIKDSVELTLREGWAISCRGEIKSRKISFGLSEDSRYAVLRNVLKVLEDDFKFAYGENYKNLDGQAIEEVAVNLAQQKPAPIVQQKAVPVVTPKTSKQTPEQVTENGVSKEIEALINKKVDEKIKNLVETKLESIIKEVLFKNIKTNKKFQKEFQEIIKTSTNEVGEALTKLAREYTNSVQDTNHPQRGLLGELHNELSKLLELANSDYRGGLD